MTRVENLKKSVVQGAKDYAGMFKEFHDAFKTRKEDYNKHVGNTGKKK